MTPPHARSFVALAASEIGDDNRQWIEVMPTAEKARNGKFYFTVTAADLEVYAESIREQGDRIPIDRDHEGDIGGSTRAAGWFTGQARIDETDDRGPILMAEVEWTPRAAQEIKDGEFRFTSPVFTFREKDKTSGLMTQAKRVAAGTLTNRPFFDELAALAAEDVVWRSDQGYLSIQQKINGSLNPSDGTYRYWVMDIDVQSRKALVQEYSSDATTWVVPFTLDSAGEVEVSPTVDWVEAQQEWVSAASEQREQQHIPGGNASATTQGEGMSEELKALAVDLGLPEDATAEDISTAAKTATEKAATLEAEITELKAAASAGGDKVVSIDKARLEQLEQQAELGVTAHQKQIKDEAEAIVSAAIKDGRIARASRDSWMTAILPEGKNELVEAEVTALASLTKGRVPVEEVASVDNSVLATDQVELALSAAGIQTSRKES